MPLPTRGADHLVRCPFSSWSSIVAPQVRGILCGEHPLKYVEYLVSQTVFHLLRTVLRSRFSRGLRWYCLGVGVNMGSGIRGCFFPGRDVADAAAVGQGANRREAARASLHRFPQLIFPGALISRREMAHNEKTKREDFGRSFYPQLFFHEMTPFFIQ